MQIQFTSATPLSAEENINVSDQHGTKFFIYSNG